VAPMGSSVTAYSSDTNGEGEACAIGDFITGITGTNTIGGSRTTSFVRKLVPSPNTPETTHRVNYHRRISTNPASASRV
jgi:hypothetical protein